MKEKELLKLKKQILELLNLNYKKIEKLSNKYNKYFNPNKKVEDFWKSILKESEKLKEPEYCCYIGIYEYNIILTFNYSKNNDVECILKFVKGKDKIDNVKNIWDFLNFIDNEISREQYEEDLIKNEE